MESSSGLHPSFANNAVPSAPYVRRAPSPPFIHIPPTGQCGVSAAPILLPSYEHVDSSQLTAHDVKIITQNMQQIATDRAADWSYEQRRDAQKLVNFLYLGPNSTAKDIKWLQEEGITMIAVARDARMAGVKLMSVEKAAKTLDIEVRYVDLEGNDKLISSFPDIIRLINDHLLSVYHSQAKGRNTNGELLVDPSSFRRGKVLLTCETGNDRSAAIAAAYIMAVFGKDMITAVQFISIQRFCCAFDEDIKRKLQCWEDILRARSQVAMEQAVPPNAQHTKRHIDDVMDTSEDPNDKGEFALDQDRFNVKWIILRVFSNNNRFAKLTSLILHLSNQQVKDFMEIYLREYYSWRVWQEIVEKIPNDQLLEHALEKRQTVAELLREHRPLLYTDNVPDQDKQKGVEFLQGLKISGVVEEFLEYTENGLLDFLRLDIEWEFLQDAIDKQQMLGSLELGWLDPEKVELLMAQISAPESPTGPFRYPELGDPFLGTIKRRLTPLPADTPDEDVMVKDDGYDSDATHDATEDKNENDRPRDNGKQPACPEKQDEQAANDARDAPLTSLIPGPLGEVPLPYQRNILQMASQRYYHQAYTHLKGKAVSTLVEEERTPHPPASAYCPTGFHYLAKQKQVRGLIGPEGGRRSMHRGDVEHGEGSARQEARGNASMAAGRMSGAPRLSRRGLESRTVLTSHFEDALLNDPRYDYVMDQRQKSVYLEEVPKHDMEQEEQYASFTSAPDEEPLAFVQASGSTLQPNQYSSPTILGHKAPIDNSTPSEQLRQMLDANWSGFLKKKGSKSTANSVTRQSRVSQDIESDVEADPMTMPIDVPEPEKDGDYNPKKRTPKKSGRGRPRKASLKKRESEGGM
ncbi:tyrosine phosphatase [Fusarium acutatum]|uniref:Tyrosine phosphatase n=1 Tax=Fusarium acutatum TaxID=78861 RepID=A0A8H4JB74_9HYPO|nr:tyrosine phosphatase [Fusarium acutatum]